jgi:hypothetical protein
LEKAGFYASDPLPPGPNGGTPVASLDKPGFSASDRSEQAGRLFHLWISRASAQEKVLAEFKFQTPWFSGLVFQLSRWLAKYWYVLAVPGLLFGLPALGLSTYWVRHHRGIWLNLLWWLALVAIPLAANSLVWLSWYVPVRQLIQGLQG